MCITYSSGPVLASMGFVDFSDGYKELLVGPYI